MMSLEASTQGEQELIGARESRLLLTRQYPLDASAELWLPLLLCAAMPEGS